jgi:hypothetical protein
MKVGGRGRARTIVVFLALVAVAWVPARAQPWSSSPLVNLTAGGLIPLPPPPPAGAWGEIIFANTEWLVIQNQLGQQFPIRFTDVVANNFLVRWPTTPSALNPMISLVEAMGPTIGSNTVNTGHIDVYEGADQSLVRPIINTILPINQPVTTLDPTYQRNMNAFDIASQNMLYGWAFPVNPATSGIPGQMYVVGVFLRFNPLSLGTPGNVVATVLPDASNNITMTQVTRGLPVFAQKGDIAYLVPTNVTARGLVLSQLVLYKKVPRDKFTATSN